MNARAFLISFYTPPKHHHPPDINAAAKRQIFCSDSNTPVQFRFRFRFLPPGCSVHVLEGLGRRRIGKVWADVKSEPYDIAESAPKSVKFEEPYDVVLRNGEEEATAAIPWWEEFPKRWVIVILCFSAFLLCNMDRVS